METTAKFILTVSLSITMLLYYFPGGERTEKQDRVNIALDVLCFFAGLIYVYFQYHDSCNIIYGGIVCGCVLLSTIMKFYIITDTYKMLFINKDLGTLDEMFIQRERN